MSYLEHKPENIKLGIRIQVQVSYLIKRRFLKVLQIPYLISSLMLYILFYFLL